MQTMKTLLAVLSMIPGLTATPPLPPRTVTTAEYNDFEVTLVEKYAEDDERFSYFEQDTCYKVNLKNIGEGYMSGIYFTFEGGYHSYTSALEGECSNDYVIAPNQEETIIVSANYNADNLDEFEIHGCAYTSFTDEVTVSGTNVMTTTKYDDYYYSHVDMSFDYAKDEKYCYGAIIKALVEEKEAYFVVNEWNNFSFTTTKEVKGNENNEAELVKLLKTEYIGYDEMIAQRDFFETHSNAETVFDNITKGCRGSIFFGVPAAASLGLVTTFVVALHRTVKKNKNK